MCQGGVVVLCRARRDDSRDRLAKFRSSFLVMAKRGVTFLTRRDIARQHLRVAINQFP